MSKPSPTLLQASEYFFEIDPDTVFRHALVPECIYRKAQNTGDPTLVPIGWTVASSPLRETTRNGNIGRSGMIGFEYNKGPQMEKTKN